MIKQLIIILAILFITLPVSANDIGYINYNKVLENYNFAKTTKQELSIKAQEIEKYLAQKEEEFQTLESPVQRNKLENEVKAEMEKRENAFNDLVSKREEVVKQKIKTAIDQIRTEKGLSAVIDEGSIYSGGCDVTDSVIELLNK